MNMFPPCCMMVRHGPWELLPDSVYDYSGGLSKVVGRQDMSVCVRRAPFTISLGALRDDRECDSDFDLLVGVAFSGRTPRLTPNLYYCRQANWHSGTVQSSRHDSRQQASPLLIIKFSVCERVSTLNSLDGHVTAKAITG